MNSFERERESIYEDWFAPLQEQVEVGADVSIVTDKARAVSVDDCFGEVDFVIDVTVGPSTGNCRLAVMASDVDETGGRELLQDVEEVDEQAVIRTRRYAEALEDSRYYGLTDGETVFVSSLDPSVGFEQCRPIDELSKLVAAVVAKQRQIGRERAWIERIQAYHGRLLPFVTEALETKITESSAFEEAIGAFLKPVGDSTGSAQITSDSAGSVSADTVSMLAQQATYLLIDRILCLSQALERGDLGGEIVEPGSDIDTLLMDPPGVSDRDQEWSKQFWANLERVIERTQPARYGPIFDPVNCPLNRLSLEDFPDACAILQDLFASVVTVEEPIAKCLELPVLANRYEDLIPPGSRWKWGQVYTPPTVARLLSRWTIRQPDATVLDPACGTGRFLEAAADRLVECNDTGDDGGGGGCGRGETAAGIGGHLYGVEINQFPAHLAKTSLRSLPSANGSQLDESITVGVDDFFSLGTADWPICSSATATDGGSSDARVAWSGRHPQGDATPRTGRQGLNNSIESIDCVDAIVMNPPYTRQEGLDEEYKQTVRKIALEGLGDDGQSGSMSAKAGLYSYFIAHATKFLREGGRFGMIVQNSWLDVDYGKDLQRLLLERYEIHAIVGTKDSRLIETADVNTVIVLLRRQPDRKARDENMVKFVQLKRDVGWYERTYGFDRLLSMIDGEERYADEEIRIYSISQETLRERGMGATTYTGSKWGKYIRAPDCYFHLLEKCADQLVCLEEVSTVRRGTRSGANVFFYHPNKHFAVEVQGPNYTSYSKYYRSDSDYHTSNSNCKNNSNYNLILKPKCSDDGPFEIPARYWRRVGGDGGPNHLLKTSREFDRLVVGEDDLELGSTLRYVLIIDRPRAELDPDVAAYVEWGETHEPSTCAVCRRDSPLPQSCDTRGAGWYDITPSLERGDILPMKNIHRRPYFWVPEMPAWIDDRLHGITVDGGEPDRLALAGMLNSTYGAFVVEVCGRVNLGQGALDVAADDHRELPIPDLDRLDTGMKNRIGDVFAVMGDRPVSSIFEEIGAGDSGEVTLDGVKDDRRELDRIVFEDVLGLSESEQLDLYSGLVGLVRDRLDKAR